MNDKLSVKELLLEDYKYFAESFWKNEEAGETRVKFFITLVTAVFAALGALFTSKSDKLGDVGLLIIGAFSLFSLLVFGFITLLRIVKRNKVTDEFKRGMDEIREVFRKHFDSNPSILKDYKPFNKPIRNQSKIPAIRKCGGLAYTVAGMNSLILAALTGVLSYCLTSPFFISACASRWEPLIAGILLAAVVFVGSLKAQFNYIEAEDQKSKERLMDITHGGGIVVKNRNGDLFYLLVTAKDKPNEWVFPKGHIEEGETSEQTAAREVLEETGIKAKVVKPIGYKQYPTDNEKVIARYYLMKYECDTGKAEKREHRFYTYKDAMNTLSFPEARELLEEANGIVEQIFSR